MRAPGIGTACVIALLTCASGWSQKPEYDFYKEFRNVLVPRFRSDDPSISPEGIADRYAAKLRSEGIAENEILRRLNLIRSDRAALESDYWNRFYLNDQSNFNREPNALLTFYDTSGLISRMWGAQISKVDTKPSQKLFPRNFGVVELFCCPKGFEAIQRHPRARKI